MVENKIIQIIHTNLKKFIEISDIGFCVNSVFLKYTFCIYDYSFEILYHFIDGFYRIKLEKKHDSQVQIVSFLTRSKKFRKELYAMLSDLNLSKKTFDNHVEAFTRHIANLLQIHNDLNSLNEKYTCDLKFDGFFLQ